MISIMSIEFPFVKVPPELREIVGEPDPETRTYRRSGTYEECGRWYDAITERFEDVGLSPGGVSMFVPVSRAAVHQRIKQGRLTAFMFWITTEEKSLFGTKRKAKQRPYVLLSVNECKAWAEELKRRMGYVEEPGLRQDQKLDRLRPAALEEEPSSDREAAEAEEFVEKDPKDRGNKRVVYKEPITRQEMTELIQSEVLFAVEGALGKLLPGKLGEKHRKRARCGTLQKDAKTKKWGWKD